jgi:hypothetical protein
LESAKVRIRRIREGIRGRIRDRLWGTEDEGDKWGISGG